MTENQAPTWILRVELNCCAKCPKKLKNKLKDINGVNHINIDPEKGIVLVSGYFETPTLQAAMASMGKKVELLASEADPMQAKTKLAQIMAKMSREKLRPSRGQKSASECKNCCSRSNNNIDKKTSTTTNTAKGQKGSCTDPDSDDDDDDCVRAQQWKELKKDAKKIVPQCSDEPISRAHLSYPMSGHSPGGFEPSGPGGGYMPRGVNPRAYYCGTRPLPPPFGYGRPPPLPYYLRGPYGGYPGYQYHPAAYNYGRYMPLPPLPPPPALPQLVATPAPPPKTALANLQAAYCGQTDAPKGNSMLHVFSDDNVHACRIM